MVYLQMTFERVKEFSHWERTLPRHNCTHMEQMATARQQALKGLEGERWVAKRMSILLEIRGCKECLEVEGARFSTLWRT